MAPLISHDFEARYEAPADRRSVGIRPLVGAADDESGESPLRKGITRLRTRIHEALDRLLHRSSRRTSDTQNGRGPLSAFLLETAPSIDLKETDDEIEVLAELPGLEAKDFAIETDGRRLMLRGQKKEETEERGRRYYYVERRFGAFTRVIDLPCQVDASKASATYRNGVLRIVLPKAPGAKERRLRVPID
jgi:HSP20 family protein